MFVTGRFQQQVRVRARIYKDFSPIAKPFCNVHRKSGGFRHFLPFFRLQGGCKIRHKKEKRPGKRRNNRERRMTHTYHSAPWQEPIIRFLARRWVKRTIMGLILLNAALLGFEAYPGVMDQYDAEILKANQLIIGLFVLEIGARILAHGGRFWRSPWNVFDFFVVAISLLPIHGSFSVLRALRIFRILSMFPKLRRVVEGLLAALPALASIAGLLLVLFYVFGVMGVGLFGETYPEWFGDLNKSLFTMFQIMTLEAWPDIVRVVMEQHPWAWVYFFLYMLLTTFMALNMFIAILVDSIQSLHQEEREAEKRARDGL
jgi:voltage-gated sodium channel